MLKRKFYDELYDWKMTKEKECLFVTGARQIGKTYIIEQFGLENYASYVYLNLFKHPEQRTIFEGSLEPNEIYKKLSLLLPDITFIEKGTLIFIDEIQVCPKARTALKFLAIDDRYDVIASGSLLGIHYNKLSDEEEIEKEISIPVGYEREVEMYALDFEEFLWANGVSEEAISLLKGYFNRHEKIPEEINERYQKLLHEYLVVGGMPEVVKTFLATSNFQAVYAEQQKIFKAYEDDIQLYAKNTEKPKILACYRSIPRQLAKEYTKFQYKTVEKHGSAKKYDNSLLWLENAGLIKLVYNVSLPEMPLKSYEQPENFKTYVTDIGMATALFGFETQAALARKELNGHAKGGIYENLIFDMLYKHKIPLNYFKRSDSTQEIEFIYEKNSAVIPIEVKSKRGSTTSLNEFISEFQPPYAFKLIDGNAGKDGTKITLPQFMAMFIGEEALL
ncbi:MAG: ATP-binding protein [Treponema sp.]|mgnify:FL=1|nr:ATP-binding protein [Treponema sp.]